MNAFSLDKELNEQRRGSKSVVTSGNSSKRIIFRRAEEVWFITDIPSLIALKTCFPSSSM